MTDIAGERQRLRDVGLEIEYRETWGARQSYTSDRRVNRPARWLFLHIAVITAPLRTVPAERAAMQLIERIGESRFGIGWSYNVGACQSGRLYEGQPLTRRGAHTVNDLPNPNFPRGSLNYDARACVLPQNVGDEVTDAQLHAAARWGAACRLSGEAVPDAPWFGHRDVTQKSCPGPIAYRQLSYLERLTDQYTQDMHPTPIVPTLENETMIILERNDVTGQAAWLIGGGPPRKLSNQERTAYRTMKDEHGNELVPKVGRNNEEMMLIINSELKRFDMELSEVD